jgi:hypothetical protein
MPNMHQVKIPYQNTGLTGKKSYAADNPGVIDEFTRATIEASVNVFKKENKQAVNAVLSRNLRLANRDAAEDFCLEAQDELDRKPYPSFDGFKIVIKYVAHSPALCAARRLVSLTVENVRAVTGSPVGVTFREAG